MKNTLRLKGVAIVVLGGLMVLMQLLKTSLGGAETDNMDYLRYAAHTITKVEKPAPTSDVVPLPFCRRSFIDLSSDPAYPIPHWVYSLPKDADKALVPAIAKNESRFKPYAVSHKGAVGLMQLMPETASYMVRNAGDNAFVMAGQEEERGAHRPRTAFDFNDPYISLAIGSRYLQHLQQRPFIGDNIVYLLAAYNAGPGMLQQWKRDYPRLSPDAFAAHIPYAETRHYIRKVINDYRRYQELLPPIGETVWVKGEGC